VLEDDAGAAAHDATNDPASRASGRLALDDGAEHGDTGAASLAERDPEVAAAWAKIQDGLDEARPDVPRWLRLDDGEVFEAAVLKIDFERVRVELSRRDADVFWPATEDAVAGDLADDLASLDLGGSSSSSSFYASSARRDVWGRRPDAETTTPSSSSGPEALVFKDADLRIDAIAKLYRKNAAARRDAVRRARADRRAGKATTWRDISKGGGATPSLAAAMAARQRLKRLKKHRAIDHPNYRPKALTHTAAEAELAVLPDGEAVIRPSSSNDAKLSLAWAVRPGVYRHVPIEDADDGDDDDSDNDDGKNGAKPRYDTRGVYIPRKTRKGGLVKYRIGDLDFEDLDQIFGQYVYPMNDLVAEVCAHRKFRDDVRAGDVAARALETLRAAAPATVPYMLWLDPRHPGYFALTWLPQAATSPRTEYLSVHPTHFRLRGRKLDKIDDAIDYFKRHAPAWSGAAPAGSKRSSGDHPAIKSASSSKTRPASASRTPSHHATTPRRSTTARTPVTAPGASSSAYRSTAAPSSSSYEPPRREASAASSYTASASSFYAGQAPPTGGAGAASFQQPPAPRPPPTPQMGVPPPPPGPGGAGRGRGNTLPAWYVQQQQQQAGYPPP